jgi:heterodisulfide reductase subunit C
MKAKIKQSIQENNLNYCVECGKCTAVCPMLGFYGEYEYDRSPRGVVERLSLAPEGIEDEEALWYCLTCQECTFFCPSGVNFQGFMTELRELLLEHGCRKYAAFCHVCGAYLMPMRELQNFKKTLEGGKTGELLSVCPQCKKENYVETLYKLALWPKRKRQTYRPMAGVNSQS